MKKLTLEQMHIISGSGGAPATGANAAGAGAIVGAIAGIPAGPAGVISGAIVGGLGVAIGSTAPATKPADYPSESWNYSLGRECIWDKFNDNDICY